MSTIEPIEINAGTWYLRALRADDRIDDRHAVLAAARDPEIIRWRQGPDPTLQAAGAAVAARAADWADERACSWAVCEPTTGEMVGEIVVDLERSTLTCWALAVGRDRGALTDAVPAVLRFAIGGLGLSHIALEWPDGDEFSARLAADCGFTVRERRPAEWPVDDGLVDVVVATLRADGGH